MADKKISDFTASSTVGNSDLFEIETSGGNSRKVTGLNVSKSLGNWVVISAQTASGSATIDFTGISAADWDELELIAKNVVSATDNVDLWLRVGTGATPTWATGASDYSFTKQGIFGTSGAGTGFAATDTTFDAMQFPITGISNVAGETQSARMYISGLESGVYLQAYGMGGGWKADNSHMSGTGAGRYNATTEITALRVMCSSGNIASGKFILRGRIVA